MDCREAQQVLSSLHDREQVDPSLAQTAQEHCAACPECESFRTAILTLDAIPGPSAPPELTERVLGAVQTEPPIQQDTSPTTEITPEDLAIASRASAEAKVAAVPWLTRTRLWVATGTIAATAAAVIFGVAVARQSAQQAALQQEARLAVEQSLGVAATATDTSAGAEKPSAAAPSASTAPDYVAFGGFVYVATGVQGIDASQLTTAGFVTSALDGTGAAMQLVAYNWTADQRGLVLQDPDGRYVAFTQVTRQVNGVTYRLETGGSLERFGEWPQLPNGLSEPARPDGSPAFQEDGLDSLGVRLFVRIGGSIESGFAIAPGTASTDPAAGNPNWTWWSRTE